MNKRLMYSLVAAALAVGVIFCTLRPQPAFADRKGDRELELPLNTNSLLVRPAAASGTTPIAASRVKLIAPFTAAAVATTSTTIIKTITGVLSTDKVVGITFTNQPTSAVYVRQAICTADTITVTLSGTPGSLAEVSGLLVRF